MAKGLSPLEKQWKAELKRIQKTLSYYQKKGYTFSGLKLPEMPKVVTSKSVQRLQAITTEKILSKADKVSSSLKGKTQSSPNDPLLREWKAELKRINKTIAYYQKKGYTFERLKLPPTPKTVTQKSVERLQAITTEKILSKGNIKVGNRTLHIPTAQKKGLVRTKFKFEKPKKPVIKGWTYDADTGQYLPEIDSSFTYDPTTGEIQAKDSFPVGEEDRTEEQEEPESIHEAVYYTPEEFNAIKSELGLPDSYENPDEARRTFETIESDIDFVDSFDDRYPENYIDEMIDNWDSSSIYYVSGHGVVFHIDNVDWAQEKAHDAFRLRELFNDIKRRMDAKELLRRLEENREILSDLIEIIMYKAYSEEEVTEALEEFERILTE